MRCPHCGALWPDPEDHPTEALPGPPTSGAATSTAASFEGSVEPGTMLGGRFRVLSLAGRGAMGEVYRALDLKLDQTVALKTLPGRISRDPERLARLLREVRVARQVSHPFVCRVYDVAEAEGRLFLTMEYIEGETLAALLARKEKLTADQATAIAREISAGLAAAHERGVLHRDLKPSNVMIDGRGVARITDFGLAEASAAVLGARAHEGTPRYMAPEQLAGVEATQQSDIYALGLILYELFAGRTAFPGETAEELRRQRADLPPPPSRNASGIDTAVDRLVLRCLDPDPSRRPRSARSVVAALPGGRSLAAALQVGQQRADRIAAFRVELTELRRAGVVHLTEADLAPVEKYHQGLLEDLVEHFDIDLTERSKQLSLGMRIVSLVGALGLGASSFHFFYRIWGLISFPAQFGILVAAPVLALAATATIAARERTGYFTNIAAFFALSSFVLNIAALSTVLNLRESPVAALLFALFAMILAYGYGLRLLLIASLVFLAYFVASLVPLTIGAYWPYDLVPPEGVLVTGLAAFLFGYRAAGGRHPHFPLVYRALGALLALVAVLVLGREGHLSYLPFDGNGVAIAYQLLGFAGGAGMMWLGIVRRFKDAIYLGGSLLVTLMYLKFFDWWWNSVPKYLFFLIVAIAAMAVLLALKRLRGATGREPEEERP